MIIWNDYFTDNPPIKYEQLYQAFKQRLLKEVVLETSNEEKFDIDSSNKYLRNNESVMKEKHNG